MALLNAVLLFLTVWFNGVPVNCLVDSGASATILSATQAVQIPELGPSLATTQLSTLNGQWVHGEVHMVANVGTAYLGWTRVPVVVLPDEALDGTGCILGANLLGRQPVVLDWQRQLVYPAPQEWYR